MATVNGDVDVSQVKGTPLPAGQEAGTAEKAAREMLASRPGSRAARIVLARSLAAGGKAEAAIAEYKNLLGDKP